MSLLDGIKEFFGNLMGDAKEQIQERTGMEGLPGDAQDIATTAGEGVENATGQAEDVTGQVQDEVDNAKDNLDGRN